ncbi:MAG: hypothetical protein LBK82_04375 [Planctomycetaceae bacterium]|nr:hypothetical protein [Planctomycetaceae bacterium]
MTPKRKAIQIAVVNLIHSRLSPTQPFSERLPTFYKRLPTFCKRLPTSFHEFSCVLCLKRRRLIIVESGGR